MDEYQEYLRMFGDLPFGMRPKFEDYQKQRGAQTARNTFSSELQKGNLDTAYKEGYEKLPLMDQLLYGVAPVTGEALATYEIPEFAKRGNVAAQEGRKLDAAGNYLVSGLNAMSMIPVVGKGAGLLGDAARVLGKGTRAAKPLEDTMGGGGPTVTPNVERMPIGTDYKVDMSLGPRAAYEPKVISLAAEAVVKAPGFEFNKAYNIEEMINRMSKYHNNPDNKKLTNPKVKRQFENFVSPEFKAKGKATPKELQEEIQKNQMSFKENHTQFSMGERPRVIVDSGRPEGIPDMDADREIIGFDTEEPSREGMYEGMKQLTRFQTNESYPQSIEEASKYGELNLQVFGSKYGDEGLFNDEYYPMHTRVGQGPIENFKRDAGSLANRITHGRYRIVEKDGKQVFELSEAQSDRFRFDGTGKQNLNFENEGSLYSGLTRQEQANQTSGIRSAFYDIAEDFTDTIADVSTLGGFRNPKALFNQFSSDLAEVIANKPYTTVFDPSTNKEILEEVIGDLDKTFIELGEDGLQGSSFTKMYDTRNFEAWKNGLLKSLELADPEIMTHVFTRLKGWVKPRGDNISEMELPLAKDNEWYDLTVKRAIQEAHEEGVDVLHIPINGKATMNQMGRGFGQEARNLGETYKKETKRVLKNIKKEYGIDITPTPVKDEFGQEFYEIELNNDTRKIQEVLKYNTGGSVKAGSTPLMNLKYT
jgi:hypothetical protein